MAEVDCEKLELEIDCFVTNGTVEQLKSLASFLCLTTTANKSSKLAIMKDLRKSVDGIDGDFEQKLVELKSICEFLNNLKGSPTEVIESKPITEHKIEIESQIRALESQLSVLKAN